MSAAEQFVLCAGTIPRAGLSVVQGCGLPNVGVMLDSWHFFRSGGCIADLTAEAVSHVTGVQLNDAPLTPAPRDLRAHWDSSLALLDWARNSWRTLGPSDFIRLTRRSAQTVQPSVLGETLTRRLLPGQGEQPVHELVSTLRAGGCQAPLGVEVFNSDLRRLPAREAAARAMQSCRRVLEIDPNFVSIG